MKLKKRPTPKERAVYLLFAVIFVFVAYLLFAFARMIG